MICAESKCQLHQSAIGRGSHKIAQDRNSLAKPSYFPVLTTGGRKEEVEYIVYTVCHVTEFQPTRLCRFSQWYNAGLCQRDTSCINNALLIVRQRSEIIILHTIIIIINNNNSSSSRRIC